MYALQPASPPSRLGIHGTPQFLDVLQQQRVVRVASEGRLVVFPRQLVPALGGWGSRWKSVIRNNKCFFSIGFKRWLKMKRKRKKCLLWPVNKGKSHRWSQTKVKLSAPGKEQTNECVIVCVHRYYVKHC